MLCRPPKLSADAASLCKRKLYQITLQKHRGQHGQLARLAEIRAIQAAESPVRLR